ncbi:MULTISPECIES: ribose 1,5-bisphosphokinase [Pectobacterium]|uniref:ribose 1,5-bisphosphokinase n=1 Tax=Pectobacterium TaxID=122277 RepID=UPI0005C54BA5|nr:MULTISPECIES: ribose 1,5-bisphosphokinase [Pectobacterium]MBN3125836.1 ribose 1,5-bisphosphokinase [Pectobacterium brasiliense]QSD22295.1 ribose 1,5-bisphosphokinase [Pectobacterium brasiliense]UPY94632.1 ribose 1,5-bisphosphokinase [Pectobacterium sp. 21LCBS03]GKV97237.1 ribose 1,5-bisphosphate phosphokinase PhnN [Pectobacterium carotovorum subsp. carotovorum]
MPKLIYLIGPSGAGKDSLLRAIRQLALPRLLVAHRYITRPAEIQGENHIALTPEEFANRQQLGLFALYWQAHQCHYGIGIEIDDWLQRGNDVIVNGSRAYLTQARERYGNTLFPICLTVSTSALRERLRARGRESEQQIATRLQRAEEEQSRLANDCVLLNNDGDLQRTLSTFRSLLPFDCACETRSER